jgi:hypothetical protein
MRKYYTELMSRGISYILKATCIGHILHRNRSKHITAGKIGGIEAMGRSRTRHRQIVDDLKEVTGY